MKRERKRRLGTNSHNRVPSICVLWFPTVVQIVPAVGVATLARRHAHPYCGRRTGVTRSQKEPVPLRFVRKIFIRRNARALLISSSSGAPQGSVLGPLLVVSGQYSMQALDIWLRVSLHCHQVKDPSVSWQSSSHSVQENL